MAASLHDDAQPIAEINTTPLVDVMLVLLIMFILVIPVTSHKVPVDLPGPHGPAEPTIHRLDLDAAGRVYWNGEAIGAEALPARLAAHVADPAQPLLQMNADGETRYERFDEVLAAVRRAGVRNLAFLNQSRFADAIPAR